MKDQPNKKEGSTILPPEHLDTQRAVVIDELSKYFYNIPFTLEYSMFYSRYRLFEKQKAASLMQFGYRGNLVEYILDMVYNWAILKYVESELFHLVFDTNRIIIVYDNHVIKEVDTLEVLIK